MFQELDLHSNPQSEFSRLTKKTHMPLGKVLLRYRDTLSALGLRDPTTQKLGKGSFGAAFETAIGGGQSTLKFTRDPYEVVASMMLRGRRFDHVVPIFEVWSLPDAKERSHWADWFLIHRAYLKPLQKRDQELIDLLFDIFVEEEHLSVPDVSPGARSMRAKWEMYVKEDLRAHRNMSELPRAMDILRQIATGIRELRSIGIDWEDFHSGNLMVGPKSTIQIADVGYGVPRKKFHFDVPAIDVDMAKSYAAKFKAPAAA